MMGVTVSFVAIIAMMIGCVRMATIVQLVMVVVMNIIAIIVVPVMKGIIFVANVFYALSVQLIQDVTVRNVKIAL